MQSLDSKMVVRGQIFWQHQPARERPVFPEPWASALRLMLPKTLAAHPALRYSAQDPSLFIHC